MTNLGKMRCALATLLLLVMSRNYADTGSPELQDAQNQSAIAVATATAMTAQATAQQALLTSQLTNQKTEISAIQSALTAPDPSKLRTVSNLSAPTVNATYYGILSKEVKKWLEQKDTASGTPIFDLADCNVVFMARPSLLTTVQIYRSTDAKLFALWENLHNTSQSFTKRWVNGEGDRQVQENALLPVVAGADAIATLATSFAAAAKRLTAVGSQSLSNAGKIVIAAIAEKIPAAGRDYYDSDGVIGVPYDFSITSKTCTDNVAAGDVRSMSISNKASCVEIALATARAALSKVNIKPLDPKATTDPDKDKRADIAALTKLVAQSDTDVQSLFAADAASGVIPYSLAAQGETFDNELRNKNACILSVATISSDADTIVRDGTFSAYKLSVATTTTISWSIASPAGQIKKAGFKALTTDWTQQHLEQ